MSPVSPRIGFRIEGILSPVLTPFKPNLEPDVARYIAHCKWLVSNNVGLAIFGTNSEAASLSVPERQALLDKLLEAGVPANRMMPGTGACSISDAVTLTKHAVEGGAAGCLMLPPFYYKGVSDEGLFAYYSEVIERVANDKLKVYLYHIPAVSGVPITLKLIEMLRKRYPDTVVGVKDSSGVWDNTKAMIDNFAAGGFDVFPGSELPLSQALAIGGVGCISATANINPAAIHAVFAEFKANGTTPKMAELQAKIDAVRKVIQAHQMISLMKRVAAEFSGQSQWSTVRPPLVKMNEATAQTVLAELKTLGFDMPNFSKV
jgi:4-hydroxy-tetrahydrodipicolinate synthase